MPDNPCVEAANLALREAISALWEAILNCFESNPVSQSWIDAHTAVLAKWDEDTHPALVAAQASECGDIMTAYHTWVGTMKPTDPTSECLDNAWKALMDRIAEIREQLLDCLGGNP